MAHPKSLTCVIALPAFLLSILQLASSAADEAENAKAQKHESPKEFSVGRHNGGENFWSDPSLPGEFRGSFSIRVSKDGKEHVGHVSVHEVLGIGVPHGCSMITQGELVPFFGALYRLVSFDEDGVAFVRVDDEELTRRFAAAPDSRIITHARPELGEPSRALSLDSIEAKNADSDILAATVESTEKYDARAGKQVVQIGDYLRIGNAKHKVLKIVPRDKKLGIVGWVEVEAQVTDPEGAPESFVIATEFFPQLQQLPYAEYWGTMIRKHDWPKGKVDFGFQRTVRGKRARSRTVYGSHLPRLTHGDVFTLFGALYRVKFKVEDAVTCELVEDKETTERLAAKCDSIIVPLQREDEGNGEYAHIPYGGSSFELEAIKNADRPADVLARMAVQQTPEGSGWRGDVKIGDEISNCGRRYKVLNIVPRDDKTGIIGWVELLVIPGEHEDDAK